MQLASTSSCAAYGVTNIATKGVDYIAIGRLTVWGHLSNRGSFKIYVNRILSIFDHLPTPSKHTQ